MSEPQQDRPEQDGDDAYTPPQTQADFDRRVADRINRERAKFADYKDLKTKAAEYDKLAEASKTDLQKALERAEAAEQRAAASDLAALKAGVAAAKGVPVSSVSGTTKEELERSADDLIAWRDQASKPKPAAPPPPASLRSGAGGDGRQLTGKERAAAALRDLRATDR